MLCKFEVNETQFGDRHRVEGRNRWSESKPHAIRHMTTNRWKHNLIRAHLLNIIRVKGLRYVGKQREVEWEGHR